MNQRPLRVVAADDHPVYLRGLVACLEDTPDVTVAAVATCGVDAVATVKEHQPDVLLLDLNLPDISGVEVVRRLREAHEPCAVLMLTMYDDQRALRAALEAGARGYLLKGADQQAISAALRTVADGGLAVGPELAGTLASMMSGSAPATQVPGLSVRENEVLALIVAGRSNAEITRELVVSAKTVRNHITHIFMKLGVDSRAAAIGRVRELGGGPSPSSGTWPERDSG